MKLLYSAARLRDILASVTLAALAIVGCSNETKIDSDGVVALNTHRTSQDLPSTVVANPDLPVFETSVAELNSRSATTIAQADADLKVIAARGAQADAKEVVTFDNTVKSIDDALYPVTVMLNRIYLIQNTSPNAELRDAATAKLVDLQNWLIAVDYRPDLFSAVKVFHEKYPDINKVEGLNFEDRKLFDDLWKEYRRAGMLLETEDARNNLKALRQQIAELETKFDENIRKSKNNVEFTEAELAGLPTESIAEFPIVNGKRVVNANVTPEYMIVSENATSADSRKRIEIARLGIAQDTNPAVLTQIVALRDQAAKALGYASHDDYKIEPKMAGTATRAKEFIVNLRSGLEPKFQQEIAVLKTLKSEETAEVNPELNLWDWRYYTQQLMKKKYQIDTEQLRVFFDIQKVTRGVFDTYQDLFGIKIEKTTAPYVWADGVELFKVSDDSDGRLLGYFYLDNFPREGKYNHFAEFGIIDGKARADGSYTKPVVSLVCNFPKATADKPALMRHDDVETFFHEFGHAMHAILTQAKYGRFAGTNVEGDFVESPSQMLEAWAWNVDVLNRFAADYRDPSVKIDPKLVDRMKEAKIATAGAAYRRQLVFALADLELHDGLGAKNPTEIGNKAFTETFFPVPAGTDFMAGFGHIAGGYDAGYYGYAWADAISQDMLTAFESAPLGMLDPVVGRRLRKEIYSVGGSRSAEESVQAFLGRPWTIEPFLKSLGIGK